VWLEVMKPHEKCSIFCFLREQSFAAWVPGCQLPSALPPSMKPQCQPLSVSTPARVCRKNEAPKALLCLKGDSHLQQGLLENSSRPECPSVLIPGIGPHREPWGSLFSSASQGISDSQWCNREPVLQHFFLFLGLGGVFFWQLHIRCLSSRN